MVTKRELVIAVLCTFCLTFTLFTILPAGSNYKTSGIGEYDPWIDSNDDGSINILDAIKLGNSFDTTGDTTKNVTVTNFPLDEYGNLKVSIHGIENYITKKAVERIIVLDSFSYSTYVEGGVGVIVQPYTSLSSAFYFYFGPKPTFINVTKVYINSIWRTTADQVFTTRYYFNTGDTIYGLVEHSVTARAWTDVGTIASINVGMNGLDVLYSDSGQSAKLYLLRLELFIEYNYLG